MVQKNICFNCEIEHNKHKTLSLVDFRPDIEKTRKRLIEIKKEVEEFSKQIKFQGRKTSYYRNRSSI